MEEIINRLVEWREKGKSYPYQIQFHPTNFCNLRCIFCPTRALVKELKRESELRKEEWLRIVEEGAELKVEEWHICGGGEPLFFTDETLEIMEKIKEYGKYGEIITNGTFFSKKVAEKIVKIGWNKIYISLDSPFMKTQNYLRQANCFTKIIKGVENLVKWKKKLKKEVPLIYFHMVVCNKNYNQIKEMIKLAYKLKVNGLSLNALNVWKPEVRKLQLKKEEIIKMKKILNESKMLAEKLNISNNINEFLEKTLYEKANVMKEAMISEIKDKKGFSSLPCYYPWYNISIFPDGNTLPCFILKDKGENVREKSLKEIWFGNYFQNIRKMFLKKKLKEDCAKCNPWNLPKMIKIREKLTKFEQFKNET